MDLKIVIHREQTGFWTEIRELPGCFASAGTMNELPEALSEAVSLYLGEEPLRVEHEPLHVGEVRGTVHPARGPLEPAPDSNAGRRR